MKVKSNELTGPALDWAATKCEGKCEGDFAWYYDRRNTFKYSTDWAQGGPIIEREGIAIMRIEDRQAHQQWAAGEHDSDYADRFWEIVCGPTPLIAAMRCYVASRLGDEVDVPDDLVWDELIYEKEDE